MQLVTSSSLHMTGTKTQQAGMKGRKRKRENGGASKRVQEGWEIPLSNYLPGGQPGREPCIPRSKTLKKTKPDNETCSRIFFGSRQREKKACDGEMKDRRGRKESGNEENDLGK